MKVISLALLTLSLAVPIAYAQSYSQTVGNWEVYWSIDAFDDRIKEVQMQNIDLRVSLSNPDIPPIGIVNFMCFERRDFRFDLGLRNLLDGEILIRIDNSQPFEITKPKFEIDFDQPTDDGYVEINDGLISGGILKDLVDNMKTGNDRIAMRDSSGNTNIVSLRGFNEAFTRFTELCPTL